MPLPLAQKLLAVPVFFNRYKQYLDTIANTVINPDSVFPRIDAMKQLIQQAAIADTYRTLDYGYTVTDFYNGFNQAIDGHTPYGIKPFLSVRQQAILSQLHPDGADDHRPAQRTITVFPNPATESIAISITDHSSETMTATISDLYGKIVLQLTLQGKTGIIPVQNLTPGMYLLYLQSSGLVYQAKFIRK
jgi:hypothetical protein